MSYDYYMRYDSATWDAIQIVGAAYWQCHNARSSGAYICFRILQHLRGEL
jgi:hypothetical protein